MLLFEEADEAGAIGEDEDEEEDEDEDDEEGDEDNSDDFNSDDLDFVGWIDDWCELVVEWFVEGADVFVELEFVI